MATIDLGKIKINWRGTYNNGTAYAIDDAVEYADGGVTSSFICTAASTGNAPSTGGTVHGSWDYLAKGAAGSPTTTRGDLIRRGASADERLPKGSNGQYLQMGADDPAWVTLSTSPTTTQGDIIYRGASADARLAKGTAGQVLKMNSGATAPEWGTDQGGKVVNFWEVHTTSNYDIQQGTTSGFTTQNIATVTFTPSSTSNKLVMSAQIQLHSQAHSANGAIKGYFRNDTASANYDGEEYQSLYPYYPAAMTIGTGSAGASSYGANFMLHNIFSVPNTNSMTWKLVGYCYNDGAAAHVQEMDTRGSHWTIMEITPT